MSLSKCSTHRDKADESDLDLEDDITSCSGTWYIGFVEENEEKAAKNMPETVSSVQQKEQVYLNSS
jgi:hypothetical protein